MTARSFKQRVALLAAFAAQVDELSPEAWERLRWHCRPLSGTTPEALFRRAKVNATPWSHIPVPTAAPALIRALPVALKVLQMGIGLSFEVITSAFPSTNEPPWTRRTSSAKSHTDRYIDAHNTLEHAMDRHHVRIPSVATAIRAAASVVLQCDLLPPATCQEVYQWVEPEVPFALVEARATTAGDTAAPEWS